MELEQATEVRRLAAALAVVAVALAGAAVHFSHSTAHPGSSPGGNRPPSSPGGQAPAEGVVCYGTVDLEHGVTALSPLQPSRVTRVRVSENQVVTGGTVLLELEDSAAQARLAEAEAARKALGPATPDDLLSFVRRQAIDAHGAAHHSLLW